MLATEDSRPHWTFQMHFLAKAPGLRQPTGSGPTTDLTKLHGTSVRHAANGRRGIETLQQSQDVDIILMDVMMPEMDGHATTAAIRGMPRYSKLPIIMVTAKAMAGDREKGLASGASDYVTKPVADDELVRCIGRWLLN